MLPTELLQNFFRKPKFLQTSYTVTVPDCSLFYIQIFPACRPTAFCNMTILEGNQIDRKYYATDKEQLYIMDSNDSIPSKQIAFNSDIIHLDYYVSRVSQPGCSIKEPGFISAESLLRAPPIANVFNFAAVQVSTNTDKDKHLHKQLDGSIKLLQPELPVDPILCYICELISFLMQTDCEKAETFWSKVLHRFNTSTNKDKHLHEMVCVLWIMCSIRIIRLRTFRMALDANLQDGSLTDAAASTQGFQKALFDFSKGQLESELSSKQNVVYNRLDELRRLLLLLPSKEHGVVQKSSSLELETKIPFLTRSGAEKQLPGGFAQIFLRSTSKAVVESTSDAVVSSMCNQQRAESKCGTSSPVYCDDSAFFEMKRLENRSHLQRESGCVRALEIEKCKKLLSHKLPFELTESTDCIGDQENATSHKLPAISLEPIMKVELWSTSICGNNRLVGTSTEGIEVPIPSLVARGNDRLDKSTSGIAVRTPSTSADGVASGCTLSAAQASDLEPECASATTVLSETSVQCADQADKNVSSYEFVWYALIIAIQAIVSFFHQLSAVSAFLRQSAETSEVQVVEAELEIRTDSQDKEGQNPSCVKPVSESLLERENAAAEEHEQEIAKKHDYPLETDRKKSYRGTIDAWLYHARNWLRSMYGQARFVSAHRNHFGVLVYQGIQLGTIAQLTSISQHLTLLAWFITSAFSRVSGACELLRLASFHAWPHLGKLSALSFSSAGFFCSGNADAVSCFSCGFTAAGWTAGTHPLAAHRERCRDRCQLIGERQGSGNIPLSKTTQPAAVCRERSEHTGLHPMGASATAASRRPNSEPSVQSPEMSETASSDAYSLVHSLLAATGATPGMHAQSINQGGYGSCDLVATGSAGLSQDEERIKWENYRLSTFANVWTYGHIVEPGDLARNGFFYKGSGDRVQCAFCQGVLRNWERGDRADEQHAQHFTYCRFVQGHEVGNMPNPFSPLVAKQVGVANGVVDAAGRRPSRQLDESERVDQPCTLLSWGTTNDLRFRHGPESSHQPRSSELPAPSSEASNQGASEPRLAGMHHVLANAGSVPRLAGDRIVAESDESRVSDDKIAPGGPEAAAAEAVAIRDHQLVDDLLHKKGDYLRPRSPIERSKAAWARNLLHHGGGAVDLLAYPVAPQASSIETARRPSSDDSAAASALARLTAAAGAAAGRGHAAAHELLRLASFLAWPHLGKLSALSFSSAGLYCTGRADEVSCFSCGLTVSQWTAAAGHPLVVHRRKCAAGQCLLIGNPPSSGNIPLSKTTQPLPPPLPSGPAKRDGDSISAAATSAAANRLASADPRGPEGGSEASMDFGLGFSLAHSLLDTAGGSSIKDTGWQGALQGSHYYQGEGLTSQQLDEERIKWESYRLSTFANVWTYGHIVEPGDLARNGFFYTGSGDRVQCAFCQGVLRNWELGDRADEQHAQHFTYCRFVQGHEVGNKPNPYSPLVAKRVDVTGSVADATDSSRESELGIIRAQPKNPDFAVDARRLLTFATWSSSNHVRPDTLAKAGFFFLGTEESVKCFFCDGVVVDWRSNVDPWVEHAQRFPTCSFLTQVKGLEFVQRHRTDEPPPNPSGQKTSFAVDPREIRARMDSPKVRILLQMDYPLDLVKEVVQKRLAAVGRDHEGPEELLADVFATHDEKQRTATAAQAAASRRTAPAEPVVVSLPRDHQPASMPMALSSLPVARAASAPIASTGDAAGLAQTPILESARPPAALEPIARAIVPEEENRQSKMQLTCKICMDSVVGIVFLPCGHLVCCAVCSPALTTCPICRVGIRGTVRTMF